jgi:hypothetical protein
MGPRPYRPAVELKGALDRGHLDHAILIAREVSEESRRSIALDVALRFLPLVAKERPQEYDAWALRWLARWAGETGATIDDAPDVAALLAELPKECDALVELARLVQS